ncbi:hypothetical protein V1521DRAFT_460965 [Lipomyces starkeyi]
MARVERRNPAATSAEMTAKSTKKDVLSAALNFLTANEPEKRLDIRLSHKSLLALEEQALALYGDASKYQEMQLLWVTIYTAPTALHGYSAVNLQQAIIFAVYNVLVQHRKQELFERIVAVGESTYGSVNEQGRRSTKAPDAGLIYYYDGEVGVSEGYPQLNANIMLWMKFHCHAYSINERPAFVQAMKQVGEHTWFGTLDKAILELVVQTGRIVVQGSSLDIGLTAIRDIQDELVHLGINFVLNMIASGSYGHDTAVSRFNHFITED